MKHILHTILLAAVASLFLSSCSDKPLLDETRTFANDTWLRFSSEQFSVTSTNTDDCYNFTVTLLIDTARYRATSLPLMLEMQSPDRENRTLFTTLILRNHEGRWMGTFTDDGLLSITHPVRQYYFFNTTGTYTVNLSQRTHYYEIHGIKSLHFLITKAKLEYPE